MYCQVVSRSHNTVPFDWRAEGLPFAYDDWEQVVAVLQATELRLPGRFVWAVLGTTERDLHGQFLQVLAGENCTIHTYLQSPEDERRLAWEMSDGSPLQTPYVYEPRTHYQARGITDHWIRLQARATRGEVGGPRDGEDPSDAE